MRSSRRSKLAAVIVFVLIATVVTGGIAWATVSSFELAKKNVTEEHERLVSRALWQMDSYIGGILYSEGSREHTDYLRVHERPQREVVAVYTPVGVELDVARVVLRSPLAVSDPPHEWIDLYFQWDPLNTKNALSSPQIADAEALWPVENLPAYSVSDRRERLTWEWLKTVLPGFDLHEHVAGVCRSDHNLSRTTDGAEPRSGTGAAGDGPAVASSSTSSASVPVSPVGHEYQQRKKSLRDSQVSYLPPPACVDASNVRSVPEPETDAFHEPIVQQAGDDVPLAVDPLTTFWLGPGPDGAQKLAFVRECHLADDVLYQGFVGDWDRLKPELLKVIGNLFPEADLEPMPEDREPDVEASKTQMINLPVRLNVPDVPGGATAAAWRRVRGTLITTWLAAAAVLVVAGWGLRNLVALTERRMQFAYSVTHELRTPLTTFRLYSDMLSAGLVPEASKQEYLDTLNRESLRLSNLVEGVLEYARLENQRVKLNPTETDGASLLRVVSETLEKRCRENAVKAQIENTLSNGERIRTDVDVVNRIAGVLVNNACRHARGGDNAAVLVRLGGEDGRVYLDVIDSGPGIDRADARSVFKPFRRGRRADTAAQGGIGLGLAMARSWAGLLGGRLELAARHHPQYGGAHFRLTIPFV